MRIDEHSPPRRFKVGGGIEISHVADVELEPDEQVTFTAGGTELDVARKQWGYYATPSLNGRLRDHGLRAALVVNADGRLYVMLCEEDSEPQFRAYLEEERQRLVCWLDSDEAVAEAVRKLDA